MAPFQGATFDVDPPALGTGAGEHTWNRQRLGECLTIKRWWGFHTPVNANASARARLPGSRAVDTPLSRRGQWNIGLARAPIQRFLEEGFHPEVEWLRPPAPQESYADPFGVSRDGQLYVLCERYDRRAGRGSIWIVDWPIDGSWARSTPIIAPSAHTAYPCVVEHSGQVYCVPETHGPQEVSLYLADPFPFGWRKIDALSDRFLGIDKTLFRYEDRWWMTCANPLSPGSALNLYYADDLPGPFQPHAQNPVKRGAASIRPGGTPFVWQGCLYRPTRDLSVSGRPRIVIHRVDELTPDVFRERPVASVEADPEGPYPLGLRTLSSAGGVTLVDGLRDRWVRWRPHRRAHVPGRRRFRA